jgi:4-diphosphocytidyl-2-C-methyl-D-erythritol kinase
VNAQSPSLQVRCPAKLNLFLDVLRRRPDGYHDLDTVMQAVDLSDDLEISPRPDSALSLECSDPRLPCDERNLVLRAALALREQTGVRAGAHFRLTKRIPAEAGLGGGSSDAAGALVGLNAAWGLGLSTEALRQVAAAVGSDVAFFLYGGTARCTGRGEAVEPLPVAAEFHYVVVVPRVSVSTAEAYRRLHFPLTPAGASASMFLHSLLAGDVAGMGESLYNRLEAPAFSIHPVLSDVKAELAATRLFAGVAMTGSGSALFGLCSPEDWLPARERVAVLGLGETLTVRSLGHGVRAHGAELSRSPRPAGEGGPPCRSPRSASG